MVYLVFLSAPHRFRRQRIVSYRGAKEDHVAKCLLQHGMNRSHFFPSTRQQGPTTKFNSLTCPQNSTVANMPTSINQRTLLLAALLSLKGTATGFVQNGATFPRPRAVAYRPTPLFALIFGPNGEMVEDWEEVEEELHSLEGTGATLGMSDKLTQEQIASLARMAAAFSPPGQVRRSKGTHARFNSLYTVTCILTLFYLTTGY